MALEVEDGTGKANADAFVSLADCSIYATAQGLTAWTSVASSPPDAKEAAIRRATQYLSTALTWKGSRLNGRDQALAWPRSGATDAEGWAIPEDEVPIEVVNACCELAAYEVANPGGLSPTVTVTDRIKREKVGPLETEYVTPPGNAEAARPVLTKVNDLVGGLLDSIGSSIVGEAVRA